MRVLHTSDWHLGQKFINYDRRAEHQLALDWLLATIEAQRIECLLVSGDIFDIGNPPNSARKLYYQFLRKVAETNCRHIVITAGNHDSPAMLDAPKELLELFSVHVVSRANTEDVTQELIELKDKEGKLEMLVAAVPFLRDQDVRKSVSGETGPERVHAVRRAIREHYEAVGLAATTYAEQGIPILAMGHLFVKDAEVSAKHDNIYIGDIANIAAADFPAVFDYVALGHIHRPQALDVAGRVQYSGSIIPLSFTETKDEKVIKILDFTGKKYEIETLALPTFRRLKTVKKTSVDAIKMRLQQLHEDYKEGLTVWVEVILETDKVIPDLDIQLTDFIAGLHLEILKIRSTHQDQTLTTEFENLNLQDLAPLDVFQKKMEQTKLTENERTELVVTFKELQAWMGERE